MPWGGAGSEGWSSGGTPPSGWTREGAQAGYVYNPATGEYKSEQAANEEYWKKKHEKESLYGRVGEAYGQEAESLEAYKALEEERMQKAYAQQLGAAQGNISGQAAGGSAAMLRGGSYGRGEAARYGAADLEVQKVAMETYVDNLFQELLARGASYQEAMQAVADEYQRLRMEDQAANAEWREKREAEKAAGQAQIISTTMGMAAAGMKGAG